MRTSGQGTGMPCWEAAVEFGSHLTGNMEHAHGDSCRRFEVAAVKSQEDVQAQHSQEPKDEDGRALVPVHVVCVPVIHHLVEALVLDRPPAVSEVDDRRGGGEDLRERGYPNPF